MNNIYIQTLKLGFENPKGISFNEVVERLEIDLSDNSFRVGFTIWFYENFYNNGIKKFVLDNGNFYGSFERIAHMHQSEIEKYHSEYSYINGEAVNKYIDYLELERTRESSKQATLFATGSLIIAILAVLLPYFISPDNINNSDRIVLVSILFTIAAGIYNAIDIAKAKPEKKKNFWSYTIIITVLSVILSFLIIALVNQLVLNPGFGLKTLVILPVFVFWLGQVIRKYRS